MGKSLLVAALFTGVIAVPVGVAQAHSDDEGRTPGAPAGMAQMHELMEQGNPGMARMHELMEEGDPAMTRMCEQMHESTADHA
ncbi:hypothetical protein [Modestobacter sp. VKM Ac-2984]|uniref:hypothetical protein n=1 Tax=Modestobacter sp. VKM Ac-2984 TaxID=3004138 RepID=UPI0022AA45E1|nr:hypothetical protein [Modestobacter sp. VKM Ac-2984]MCZ2818005.1 hypothetical protein [Modestobacter sp. VKM Ac-2984]